MANSAEALEIIRSHVAKSNNKLRLGQVVPGGGDGIAGLGVDREFAVTVTRTREGQPLDNRVFPGGVLTGVLACRAVLLEPEAAAHQLFLGRRTDDALYLRTRLQYMEPRPDSLPPNTKALTVGGTVTHVAVQKFLPGDGEQLDTYYESVAAYETALREDKPVSGRPPVMPSLNTFYELPLLPGVPNVRGEDGGQKASARLTLRRLGFEALQDAYPAARVLSLGTQGYVSDGELMDWAEAFKAEPQ